MTVASDRLAAYLDAEARILKGQSVQHGDRTLTLADLAVVRSAITELQRVVASEATSDGARHRLADLS